MQNAMRAVFDGRKDVAFDPIDYANVIWHQNIPAREAYDESFRLGDRRVISGIRRLPHWLLSRVHFEAERSPGFHKATRQMLLRGEFYEHSGVVNRADTYIQMYQQPRVDRWIRTEKMIDDISDAFGVEQSLVATSLKRENETKAGYIKDLQFWFTPDDLAGLYAANPSWADVERRVYGSLLSG